MSGVRCGIANGVSCGVRTQGTTRVRVREEPMVRWRRGMAHHCQVPHGHGIATSEVHMEIIMKFGEALPCVKSPVSRTPWKNTWIEFDRASVVTTKGWLVRRESKGM